MAIIKYLSPSGLAHLFDKINETYSKLEHTHSQYALSNDLSSVATSGSYNDLSDKPSVPTVTDIYDSTGTSAVSGKAVASALNSYATKEYIDSAVSSISVNVDEPSETLEFTTFSTEISGETLSIG